MRQEKEHNERDREQLRASLASKRRIEQNEARNLNILLQQVDDLTRLIPETNGNSNGIVKDGQMQPEQYTPTPPRRTKVNCSCDYVIFYMKTIENFNDVQNFLQIF